MLRISAAQKKHASSRPTATVLIKRCRPCRGRGGASASGRAELGTPSQLGEVRRLRLVRLRSTTPMGGDFNWSGVND